MTNHLASAEFADRMVPRFPTAPAPQAPDRAEPAAPSRTSLDGAAFSHFTESCPAAPEQESRAGGVPQPRIVGAVDLSDASHFILSLIAAHEGRPQRDILAELIAAAGEAIGLSPLLARGAEEAGDLAGLPGWARKASNRFRGGGP